MKELRGKLRRWEEAFDRRAAAFVLRHPAAAFFLMFVGLPTATLLLVALATAVLSLPLALVLGYL